MSLFPAPFDAQKQIRYLIHYDYYYQRNASNTLSDTISLIIINVHQKSISLRAIQPRSQNRKKTSYKYTLRQELPLASYQGSSVLSPNLKEDHNHQQIKYNKIKDYDTYVKELVIEYHSIVNIYKKIKYIIFFNLSILFTYFFNSLANNN